MYVMTETLARRVEASEAAHWSSLVLGLAALPGNPYGADVRQFGRLTALATPGMRSRSFVNRIFGAGDGDETDLAAAVAWLRSLAVPVRIDVSPLAGHELLLRHLARQGFGALGFQSALYGEAASMPAADVPGVTVRLAETAAEYDFAAGALAPVFDESSPRWVQWLTDSMRASFARPEWRTYIAYVDGHLAGFGQLHLADGTGCLALAGTLHAFRGRGVQTALIRRRIADAVAAGCDLITAQTGNGTVSQQNMERCGLRVAYTKAEFYDLARLA